MLRDDIDLKAFFSAVSQCEKEVMFLSIQGDRMDLRSALCQYLFSSVYLHGGIRLEGEILCEAPKDAERLAPFLHA